MAAGYNATLTKLAVDDILGKVAQALNVAFIQVEDTKRFLDVHDDAALVALGYVQADVDVMRSAYADLDELRVIYEGGAGLSAAKDFRTFSQRLYGTGWAGY